MRRILLVAVALAACTALFAGAAVAKTFVCKTVPCVGTANGDQISERKGSVVDVIRAGGGDDEVNAGRAGSDRDDVLGQGGSDVLNIADGDFRDNGNCGSGPEDVVIIDVEFDFNENLTINVDGTRGCELIVTDFEHPLETVGSPSRAEVVANSTPVPAEAAEASEAGGE